MLQVLHELWDFVMEVHTCPTDTFLIVSFSSMLEKNLRLLMESVDEVSMDANKFVNYQRQYQKQHLAKTQYLQKRVGKNSSSI